jgi:hypothetical protein
MTTQELTTQELTPTIDGFDDCCEPLGGGDFIKFDANTPTQWFYRDGSPLPKRQYVPVDCRVELVRWRDKAILDRIIQRPGDPFPDPDELTSIEEFTPGRSPRSRPRKAGGGLTGGWRNSRRTRT